MNNRKTAESISDGSGRMLDLSTTAETPHSNSAPATQVSKPGFLRRPQSALFNRHSTRPRSQRISGGNIVPMDDWRQTLFSPDADPAPGPRLPDFTGSGTGTARSSWLRRMSTLSSSQTGSPISTPRPSTPSISFSNGSSAPFIPTTPTPTIPRNKLVKRSTSQRALYSSPLHPTVHPKAPVPTLRRPATSHQRSANLQRQLHHRESNHLDDRPPHLSQPNHSPLSDDASDTEDPAPPVWQPFFRPERTPITKITARGSSRSESIKYIASVDHDSATLVLATSITTVPSPVEEDVDHPTPPSSDGIPITPPGSNSAPITSTNPSDSESKVGEKERKPRRSFTISDFLPSPSPSAWKLARTGMVGAKNGTETNGMGRRIVSAPQPPHGGLGPDTVAPNAASRSAATDGRFVDSLILGLNGESNLPAAKARTLSSPLPSLDRPTTFDIDLPGPVPSYPNSSLTHTLSSSSRHTSPSSVAASNPLGSSSARAKSHRPSGARSDRASTLVGSDLENSQILATEGDDNDALSDTVFNSYRTGATGKNNRSPPIDRIFDATPSTEQGKRGGTLPSNEVLRVSISNIAVSDMDQATREDSAARENDHLHTLITATHKLGVDLISPSKQPDGTTFIEPRPSSSQRSKSAASSEENTENDDDGREVVDQWEVEQPLWDDEDLRKRTPDRHPFSAPAEESLTTSVNLGSEPSSPGDKTKTNIFEWSERKNADKDGQPGSSPRPSTVHGPKATERGSRTTSRRGASAIHFRSHSVPLPPDTTTHRTLSNTSKLNAWILGSKGVSEDWDGDFEFDEPNAANVTDPQDARKMDIGRSKAMLVPQAILERQASVHGQFGQVKELTRLVEDLKRLRHQAGIYNLMHGRSSELWKEAEGIINLATLDDDEQDFLSQRSPHSPSFDFDAFDEDIPTGQRRQRSTFSPPLTDVADPQQMTPYHSPSRSPSTGSRLETPPPRGRARKESVATAKSVLETIHQQRSSFDPPLVDPKTSQKKLPFDTTSLRDLVTRAGVVTRALKEIVLKAENGENAPRTPDAKPHTPSNPAFSHIFHNTPSPPMVNQSPRMAPSGSNNGFIGSSISSNDHDINGHMKMMTVV